MRILILSHLLPYPANNGAKLRIFHLTRELARRHELALLCPVSGAFPPPLLSQRERGPGGEGLEPALAPLRAALDAAVAVTAVHWPLAHGERRRADWLRPAPRDVQPLQPEAVAAVHAAVQRHAPQVIVITDPALGEYLRPYAGLTRVVDIAAEHTHYIRRALRLAPLAQRPLWLLRLAKWSAYMRRLGRSAERWVVPAPSDRAALLRHLPAGAQVDVIANGVDTAALAYAPQPVAPPQLVYCGALSYAPNQDALRFFCGQIWPQVLRQVPDARLLVTGDSAAAPREVRSAPQITLAGHLPDVRPAITGSRVSIVPLRLGVGTRLKILEALALGTPVVSTALGAEGLDVNDERDILLADAPERFAAQVVRLLTDGALRARLSHGGRQLAEQRYAWPVLGAAYSTALERN